MAPSQMEVIEANKNSNQASAKIQSPSSEGLPQKILNPKLIFDHVQKLLTQGKAAEAAQVLEDACDQAPDNFELLAARADFAARSRDWELAERRWAILVKRFPGHSRAVIGLSDAMRQQQRFDAAEDLLSAAATADPNNRLVAELLARVSEGRANWPEAERRWRDITDRFPSHVPGWIGRAKACAKLNDFDGAESVATAAIALFPTDVEILGLHARVATHASRWPEAEHRWNSLRLVTRDNPDCWLEQAKALRGQRRQSEARTLLAEAAELFPDYPQLARARAEVSSETGMWVEASTLWNRLVAAEPGDRRLQAPAFEANWRAIGAAELNSYSGVQSPMTATADVPRQVMLRFESFGNDSEFAMVQRYYGAEPLGLLRWADIATDRLTAALNNNLDGVGEQEFTSLALGSDFKLRDLRFDFSSHTWVTEDQTDRDKFFKEQCRRLQYLRRNLLEDIEEGEKILVYKSSVLEPIDEVKRLHAAIRKLGPTTLLYVRKSDSDHPGDTIEILAEGLLVGYLDTLVGPGNTRIDHAKWMALLRKSLVLGKEMPEPAVNALQTRDLVQRFEGLGNNCEFGYVQRIEGAEPLGLLRWSTTKVSILADAFEQNLAGIGEPQHTELYTHLDYRAVDTRYGLSVQTFVSAEQTDRALLLMEQCRRMRFLRRQLLSDLKDCTKIFVHKTARAPSMDEIIALHASMQQHAPATLLHVRTATQEFPSGTLREIQSGLLVGYIDRLVAVGGGWDIAHESWLTLCRRALDAKPSITAKESITSVDI